MSERARRQHALDDFLARYGAASAGDAAVRVTVQNTLGLVNLRGPAHDRNFLATVEQVLGQPLPVVANTLTRGGGTAWWLGPDEWLLDGPGHSDLAERLHAALADYHAAINPQDGGLVRLQLTGPAARVTLARGCTLDLHPAALAVDRCAQTGLGKATVLLALDDNTPRFTLIVRRSFADYLARWLAQAGSEAGIHFARPGKKDTI